MPPDRDVQRDMQEARARIVREFARGQRRDDAASSSGAPRSLVAMSLDRVVRRIGLEDVPAPPSSAAALDLERFCDLLVAPGPCRLSDILDEMCATGVSVDVLYEDYIAGAARELGRRWVDDRLTFIDVSLGVGRLHALVRDLGAAFFPGEPMPMAGCRALMAPVPGESHVLGITMAADHFRRAGWTVDLMTEPTVADLMARARASEPAVIGLSAGFRQMVEPLGDLVASLRAARPDALICVGGHIVELEPNLSAVVGADRTTTDAPAVAASLCRRIM